jgi:hypothetical protein
MFPAVCVAQIPGGPARPAFRVLRFDENWEGLRGSPSQDGFDRLKYLPLSEGGSLYLSLGGQIRTRAEAVDNFMLTDAPERTDAFGLMRALLHADLQAGPHLRAFVEGKHSMAFGRELPGGKRPLDHDEWELQNAFVDLACCSEGAFSLTARAGRQELLVGSQRLVSPLDWSNTRRTFEGVRLMTRLSALALDGFATRPVAIQTSARNTRDSRTTFLGASVRPATPSPRLGWEIYALRLAQDDSTTLWGYEGAHERFTVGGRLTGTLGSPAARFDIEGGGQRGELAEQTISAWFVATDVSRSFPGLALKPVAALGLDYASGDSDPDDDEVGTFHQLYPLGHAYAGFMDVVGRQNLIEARGVLTATPSSRIQARASVHRFLRARTSDSAYNVGGGVLPGSPGSERAIGSELDLTSSYLIDRHTRVEVGYGHFRPGGYLEGTATGAVPSNWIYASTSFTF